MMEEVLEDLSKATALRAIILRYFNPIGADPDLETGYHLRDATHVVPLMAQTALGFRDRLHDHRHRPPDPRRHGHPRLHPRLGPGQGPRARGRGVRRRAGEGRRDVHLHQPRLR
ncbi:hypothetical protein [Nocardioides convexus]|uniref:hypothetical protein n=1 Tax=Nocardioides convexus TaxID=2712224 RepID=UPI0024189DC8|nr:hypothetical protein [Nocardioides convexus]